MKAFDLNLVWEFAHEVYALITRVIQFPDAWSHVQEYTPRFDYPIPF